MHPDLPEIKSRIETAVKAMEPFGEDMKVTVTGSLSTWRVLLDALKNVPPCKSASPVEPTPVFER